MSLSLASIQFKAALAAIINNTIDNAAAGSSVSLGISQGPPVALTNGTGANQANRFWQSTGRTLTGGTNEDLNLYSFAGLDIGAGAGNGPLGGALAQTEIVGLLIVNESGSVGNLNIGGQGTANAWTSWISSNAATVGPFKPGSCFEMFVPLQPALVVGAANNNLLRIAAAGGNVLYDIYILGRQ
jgi:hypothetical protein